MKCTACNQPVKPVVAFDIDGTIGDYPYHFFTFAEGYLNREGEGLAQGYDGSLDYATYLGISKPEYRLLKLAYRQGGLKRTMPIFLHAQPLINGLRESGVEVWIATTRPYLRLDNVDPDTRHWLERHGVQYDGLIYDEKKYERLAEIVGAERICGVVEDLPELFDNAWELGLRPIQHWTKYNRTTRREPGHHLLEVIGDMLYKQIEEWRDLHANH